MTLATNKLRILGKRKDPVTGEFSPMVKQPIAQPKPKPAKKTGQQAKRPARPSPLGPI